MEANVEVLSETLVTFVTTWGLRVVGALVVLAGRPRRGRDRAALGG